MSASVSIGLLRASRHPPISTSSGRYAVLDIHGHLGFFPHDATLLRPRQAAGADVGVVNRGAYAKTDAAKAYAETAALVFCVPGARFVTSGKVFEYMATGKPIVSVHEPGITAADVLTGYPLWFNVTMLNE